jgi:hypothetical protein
MHSSTSSKAVQAVKAVKHRAVKQVAWMRVAVSTAVKAVKR